MVGWGGGLVAGEIENKAIFQLDVEVDIFARQKDSDRGFHNRVNLRMVRNC